MVDASQLGKGRSCVLANQYFTQLWHDISFVVISAIMLQETAVTAAPNIGEMSVGQRGIIITVAPALILNFEFRIPCSLAATILVCL